MTLKIKHIILGKPKNPLSQNTRKQGALAAFFAWITFGAAGISSAIYGTEHSFLSLGNFGFLVLFLIFFVILTVFFISYHYIQIIKLFPGSSGLYKAASNFVSPFGGLISGVSLMIGYVLTIVLSVTSGVNVIFSLLPINLQNYKMLANILAILLLIYLNLRGTKEAVKFFVPIFFGFIITHVAIIIYGIFINANEMPTILQDTVEQTKNLSTSLGFSFIIAILMQAYSLGGAIYIGLETVSNSAGDLADPKIRTAKWTMFYTALSLSFIASGLLLLYFFYPVFPQEGRTLNAIVFETMLQNLPATDLWVIIILAFEAGLLFIGANSGFVGGSHILANMAIDGWVARKYRTLSNRLVTQHGIILFGLLAFIILFITSGVIPILIVLYCVSIFIAFVISLLGLALYLIHERKKIRKGLIIRSLALFIGFIIGIFILVNLIINEFRSGGLLAIVMNIMLIIICLLIAKHYRKVQRSIKKLDKKFYTAKEKTLPLKITDFKAPTAVFFIGDNQNEGEYALIQLRKTFPNNFKNFVFVSVGIVDVDSYESDKNLAKMQKKVKERLNYFQVYSNQQGIPNMVKYDFSTDHVKTLVELSIKINNQFTQPIFFAPKVTFRSENWFNRRLHNGTPLMLQRYLHMQNMQMFIFPLTVDDIF